MLNEPIVKDGINVNIATSNSLKRRQSSCNVKLWGNQFTTKGIFGNEATEEGILMSRSFDVIEDLCSDEINFQHHAIDGAPPTKENFRCEFSQGEYMVLYYQAVFFVKKN